jgi:hypothetical protein
MNCTPYHFGHTSLPGTRSFPGLSAGPLQYGLTNCTINSWTINFPTFEGGGS